MGWHGVAASSGMGWRARGASSRPVNWLFADSLESPAAAYCMQRMVREAIQHAWRRGEHSLAQDFSLSFW